jgi:hypothetical protein
MLNVVELRSPARTDLGCATHPIDSIKTGQQAWARLQLHSTWDDWKKVGIAIAEGRTKAMAAAKTNQPRGRRYNTEFGAWLRVRGFDDLEATTRKRLLQCMENIDAIEVWLKKLALDKRLKLNHPTTVLSAWKRSTAESKPKKKKQVPDWVTAFKQTPDADKTRGLERIHPKDFLKVMPVGWHPELTRLVNNLPHAKAMPFIKASEVLRRALSLIKIATTTPGITPAVAASNEKESIAALRQLQVMLARVGIDEVTIIQQYAKERRRAS